VCGLFVRFVYCVCVFGERILVCWAHEALAWPLTIMGSTRATTNKSAARERVAHGNAAGFREKITARIEPGHHANYSCGGQTDCDTIDRGHPIKPWVCKSIAGEARAKSERRFNAPTSRQRHYHVRASLLLITQTCASKRR